MNSEISSEFKIPTKHKFTMWLMNLNSYRRQVGLVLWFSTLLIAPLMVFNEYLANNQKALMLWVALIFSAPFFVFNGLVKLRQFGLLITITLVVAVPFFTLNALFHAHHMMTLGSAGLTQTEIPVEQMRVLWLSLVIGNTLSFVALTIATLVVFSFVSSGQSGGFIRYAIRQLLKLFLTIRFWLFAFMQVIFFVMINTPSGPLKISGMLLFACSVLLLFVFHERKASIDRKNIRSTNWTERFSIALVILSVPVLYILLNGFVDYLVLMAMDQAAANIVEWFEPGSAMPGFAAIGVAKFISQWLNLWPMGLLLCAALTLRRITSER